MFKKILLLSALFCLLFSGMAGQCFADISAQFEQAKGYRKGGHYEPAREIYQDIIQNYPGTDYALKAQGYLVILNISAGKNDEAQEALDKLVADFNDHPDLPEALLYNIATKYEKSGKYEEAKAVCRQIIQRYPDSSSAGRAQLAIPATDVLSLTESGNDAEAQEALDKLVADFNDHPDLPEVLSYIARRCKDSEKYQKAESMYKDIIQNYPDTDYALLAQRELALWYISVRRDDDAQTAIDSLIADFSEHPDLLEVLYDIAGRYEWLGKYEEAESVYRRIMQQYPDSSSANRAQLSVSKTNVLSLIDSGEDSEAQTALDGLIADFSEHPGLLEVLHSVAGRYERAEKYEKAKRIYEQIIQRYPNISSASRARLEVSKIYVLSLIKLGEDGQAQSALDRLITDFSSHLRLTEAVFVIGEEYYNKALQMANEGRDEQAKDYFQKTIAVWERVIQGLPPSTFSPWAYYFSGYCYSRLGKYEKSIEYYQKVVEDWPDYQYAWHAQFRIGNCYERLKNSGSLSESEANRLIEQTYEAVIEKYPDCPSAKHASLRLGWLNFERGQLDVAAGHFELFLEMADPDDPRIESVELKLEEIRRQN